MLAGLPGLVGCIPSLGLQADSPLFSCRDADTLVSLEGIKALVGHHPPLGPGLTAQSTATPQEELMGNRMCIRAWSMVVAQVGGLRASAGQRYWQAVRAAGSNSNRLVCFFGRRTCLCMLAMWLGPWLTHCTVLAKVRSPSPAAVNETVMSGATGCIPNTAFHEPQPHHRCTTFCAWQPLASQSMQASTEIVYVPGAQPEEAGTLAGAIGARIREGLASTSAALVCGAARAAGQPFCDASAALRCVLEVALCMPPAPKICAKVL